MTPIVIAFTPNYIVPAAVTLRSILDASPEGRFEVLCLVTEEIPQRQKDELEAMAGERMIFRYLSLAGRLEGYYIDPRYSEAASYRLLLPELLPDVDKIIYIDCDIVVRQDLAALYSSTELGDNLIAAIYEAPIEGQAERWKALGCDSGKYFNSGFLIMNLKQMREEGTSRKLLDALRTDWLEFPDQDALNQVCQGRVLPLSPIYNGIRTFFLPQYKKDFLAQYGSEALWDEVQTSGTIHYTGGKPWNLFTVKFDKWWRVYYSLPPTIKSEQEYSRTVRLLSKIYLTKIGKNIIDCAQNLHRRIKHSAI